jgi:hypothetical protein
MRVALLPLAALAVGCAATDVEFEVDHYRVPCVVDTLQLCLLVKDSQDRDWDLLFADIEDYTHTWGQRERILVSERRRTSATTGGESLAYRFEGVLDTEPIEPGTTFLYPFRPDEETEDIRAVTTTEGGGELLDGKGFVCQDSQTCAELEDGIGSNGSVILTFVYNDPVTDPFTLTSVSLAQ